MFMNENIDRYILATLKKHPDVTPSDKFIEELEFVSVHQTYDEAYHKSLEVFIENEIRFFAIIHPVSVAGKNEIRRVSARVIIFPWDIHGGVLGEHTSHFIVPVQKKSLSAQWC